MRTQERPRHAPLHRSDHRTRHHLHPRKRLVQQQTAQLHLPIRATQRQKTRPLRSMVRHREDGRYPMHSHQLRPHPRRIHPAPQLNLSIHIALRDPNVLLPHPSFSHPGCLIFTHPVTCTICMLRERSTSTLSVDTVPCFTLFMCSEEEEEVIVQGAKQLNIRGSLTPSHLDDLFSSLRLSPNSSSCLLWLQGSKGIA